MASSHPLPAAPGEQRLGQGRPRAKSSFSFHSRKSSGSGHVDLHETHEEKERKRLTTKADPSMALKEAEPAAVASGEKASLQSIRSIQHRDTQGNLIADPDRSNPTRSRWERPLDTIRSFEAAIDGDYTRKSYIQTESDNASQWNRRSSYFGGTQVSMNDDRPRISQSGYYGSYSQPFRPESSYYSNNGMSRPGSYYYNGVDNAGPSNGYYPNRARYPRTASEPHFNNFNNGQGSGVYPMHGNHQSYETVTTASGSGSSAEPTGYSTDPSSENSSVDRITPLPPKEPVNDYGIGFGAVPQYAPPGQGINLNDIAQRQGSYQGYQGNEYQNHGPPPVPRKESSSLRNPVNLNDPSQVGNPATYGAAPRPGAGEKRKSWFGKRFSRS